MKQLSMSFLKNYKKEFGGSLLVGKRKSKRPLSTKHPIHLVLRSELKRVFHPSNQSLDKLIKKTAKEFNIKIYDFALNWSHIHMLIRLQNKEDYTKFIRALTSKLALGIRKAKPNIKSVFTLRPFTRILTWGRDFRNALNYQIINRLEAKGLIRREKKAPKAKSFSLKSADN